MAAKRFVAHKNSKKTTIDIASLEAEKNRLYISGEDPLRLEEVKAHLDYIFYGVVKRVK